MNLGYLITKIPPYWLRTEIIINFTKILNYMDDLSLEYKRLINSEKSIGEALKIADLNSNNRSYWLIGGVVYKLLNKHLHGKQIRGVLKEISDVDILFECPIPHLFIGDYVLSYTSIGEPRLRKGDMQIDLINLTNVAYIRRHNLKPTIENYLAGTFTDVQNIAFDMVGERLIGSGISALRNRRITINNKQELKYYCGIKGITIYDYLERLSISLGMPVSH